MNKTFYRRSVQQCAFDAGRWPVSLIGSARLYAESSERSQDWITYFDTLLALKGVSLSECLELHERFKAPRSLPTKLRLKLSNTILAGSQLTTLPQSERLGLCEQILEAEPLSSFAVFTDLAATPGYLGSLVSHYPALLSDLSDPLIQRMPFSNFFPKYRLLAAQLKDSITSFQEGINQCLANDKNRQFSSKLSVAVVGNSPALLDQGHGEEIDSHDIVVRFNRISANSAQAAHTGKRTDIWVMSPSTPIELCPPDTKMVIVSGLNALTRPSFYWRKLPAIGKPLAEFDASTWYELVQRFNAPPSAGALAIAALRAYSENIQINRFGFTTSQGVHGLSANHHNDHARASSRHNWQAEVNWLREIDSQSKTFIVSRQ